MSTSGPSLLQRLRNLLTGHPVADILASVLGGGILAWLLDRAGAVRASGPAITWVGGACLILALAWAATIVFVRPFRPEPSENEQSAVPRPRAPTPPGLNLPSRNPNFTGRRELLDRLHQALSSGRATAVTQAISGLGGIGKTQLAIEYCHRHLSDYSVIWWLRAEHPATLTADYAALAERLDLPEKESHAQNVTIAAVRAWLEGNRGWLLVFDNAQDPTSIRDYIPRSCPGSIIITSRHPTWSGHAEELDVPTLPRPDSVRFLLNRTESRDVAGAEKLAARLGDLPLALEQAAAYIDETACSIGHYLALLDTNRAEVLDRRSRDAQYPESVASTWEISIRRVEQESAVGAALLNLAAFLAPDDVPLDLLFARTARLPEELVPAQSDPMLLDRARAALLGLSLARFEEDAMSVHRLVQAVAQERMGPAAKKWAEAAVVALDSVFPSDSDDVKSWPACGRLLHHALASVVAAERMQVAAGSTGRLFYEVGVYYNARAMFSEAEPLMRRALKTFEDDLGPGHPTVATQLTNLAQLMQGTNRSTEAEPLMRRALRTFEDRLGPDHPTVATQLTNLAQLLQATNRPAEAEPLMRRALRTFEDSLGPDHPMVATQLNNLAELLRALNRPTEAEPLMRRALEIDERSSGPDHPKVARDLGSLAQLLGGLNRPAEAEPLMRRALKTFEDRLGPNDPTVATQLGNLAQLLQATNRLTEAEPLMRRQLVIHLELTRTAGHPDPRLVGAIDNYRVLLNALGRSEDEIRATLSDLMRPFEAGAAVRDQRNWGN